jgi:type IV pilus assembly protein PilV
MKRVRIKRRGVGGYALLEALVAVVVASVGFIGAARLQTVGIKMNSSSQLRQKAVLLAYQMTDRIRANRGGAAAYHLVAPGAMACLTAPAGCTSAQLAVADMTEWSADIAGQLPGGTGRVCVDSTAPAAGALAACDGLGEMIVVQVSWTDAIGTTRFNAVLRP